MAQYNTDQSSLLIVVGMHRSGTSLTTSLLQSAGLHIGRRLMSSNEGNIKGYFENLDFYHFHQDVLKSQGVSEDGWTLQEQIEVEDRFVDRAKQLVERSQVSRTWGWKDPRTTLFLDFWAKQLPEAKFLLVYRSPWEVTDSLYRRGFDRILREQPELAVKMWLHYNRKILTFYNQATDRCFLVNIDTLLSEFTACVAALNQKFAFDLTVPTSTIYDSSLYKRLDPNGHRASLVAHYFPEAVEMYRELEARSWQHGDEVDLSWLDRLQSLPYRHWAFEDWARIGELGGKQQKLQEQLQESESKIQKLEAEFVQTVQERDRDRTELHQKTQELENSQGQLHEREQTLAQTQSQLHQTQEEFAQTQSQLHQTQEVLEQSQAQLHDTETVLEQSVTQLQQKTEQLQQSESQIYQLQEKFERAQAQLNRNTQELKQSRDRIRQTEAVLEQSQAQLHDTEAVLEQSMTQLHRKTEQLQQSESQICQLQDKLERGQAQVHQLDEELLQSQAQLHQTQEELAQLSFTQGSRPTKHDLKQMQYSLLVREAWVGYRQGNLTQMKHCLEKSLRYTSRSRTEAIALWLNMFSHFCAKQGGDRLDIYSLTTSPQWKQLIGRTLGIHQKTPNPLPNPKLTSHQNKKISNPDGSSPPQHRENAQLKNLRFNVDRCEIVPSDRLNIRGWIDPRPKTGINYIEVRLNEDLIQQCRPFLLRPDVAKTIGDEGFLTSGWSCSCDLNGETIDPNAILTIHAIAQHGDGRLLYSKPLAQLYSQSNNP